MSTNQQVHDTSFMNVENQPRESSSKLITNDGIPDTPFRVVGNEKGWFITMGKWRMSEMMEKKEEAIRLVTDKSWTLILSTVTTLIEAIEDQKNSITQKPATKEDWEMKEKEAQTT